MRTFTLDAKPLISFPKPSTYSSASGSSSVFVLVSRCFMLRYLGSRPFRDGVMARLRPAIDEKQRLIWLAEDSPRIGAGRE